MLYKDKKGVNSVYQKINNISSSYFLPVYEFFLIQINARLMTCYRSDVALRCWRWKIQPGIERLGDNSPVHQLVLDASTAHVLFSSPSSSCYMPFSLILFFQFLFIRRGFLFTSISENWIFFFTLSVTFFGMDLSAFLLQLCSEVLRRRYVKMFFFQLFTFKSQVIEIILEFKV